MPLYEYECDACGHRFEVIQKFSDAPITVCPKCGGSVHKLIAAPAFQLKGSGWYLTDYAKKDTGGAKGDSKESGAKDSEKKSDTKADKPAKSESSSDKASSSDKGSSGSEPPSTKS